MFTDMTRMCRQNDTLATPFVDGIVLLNPHDDCYYSLNPLGSALWAHMDHPVTVRDLSAYARSRYPAIAPELLEADLRRFLDQLLEAQLITLLPAQTGLDG